MAGVKGMRHKRPRTREERDEYALIQIEHMIDEGYTKCAKCKTDIRLDNLTAIGAQLMMARYHKLRPTLSSSEVKIRVESMSDVLRRVAERAAIEHDGGINGGNSLPAIEHKPVESMTYDNDSVPYTGIESPVGPSKAQD